MAVARLNVPLKPSDETGGPGSSPDLPLASWWCGPNNPLLSLGFSFRFCQWTIGCVGWETAIPTTPARWELLIPLNILGFIPGGNGQTAVYR